MLVEGEGWEGSDVGFIIVIKKNPKRGGATFCLYEKFISRKKHMIKKTYRWPKRHHPVSPVSLGPLIFVIVSLYHPVIINRLNKYLKESLVK